MQQGERHYEFLEPWWSTDEQDAHFHETFLNQLKTEVAPGHIMYGLPVRMIGRDGGSDDTLFEILDGSGRLALVHLTWAKGPERLPWPGTSIYPNFGAFAAEEMIPKNRDYLEGQRQETAARLLPGAPFVLAVDDATEAALEHQVGLHVLSPNHRADGVALIGIIVGAGHPATLSAVEEDGSLRALREVVTSILRVEVAGPDARPPEGEVTYGDMLLYRPTQPAAVKQRPWWRSWGRG